MYASTETLVRPCSSKKLLIYELKTTFEVYKTRLRDVFLKVLRQDNRRMSILEKLSRAVNQWIEYSLFGLGLSMSIIVAVQVFCRYVLNHSLFWSEELARYLLVWLTFLGASVAYYRGMHPGIDVIYVRLPDTVRKAAAVTVHLLSMALFAIMIIFGVKFAYFIRHQISPALYLPKWLVFTIIPLSGTVLMLHGLIFFLEEIKGKGRDS